MGYGFGVAAVGPEVRRESGGLFLRQVDSGQGEPWYLTWRGVAWRGT